MAKQVIHMDQIAPAANLVGTLWMGTANILQVR